MSSSIISNQMGLYLTVALSDIINFSLNLFREELPEQMSSLPIRSPAHQTHLNLIKEFKNCFIRIVREYSDMATVSGAFTHSINLQGSIQLLNTARTQSSAPFNNSFTALQYTRSVDGYLIYFKK